jgi:arginine utilization regulatory protein
VRLPPLRERPEDIIPLARHFITKHQDLVGGMPPDISDKARETLVSLPWPGNIRMLENVIVRSLIMQEPGKELSTLSLFESPAGAEAQSSTEATAPRHPAPPERRDSLAASPGALPRRLAVPTEHPGGPYCLADRMAALERSFIIDALVACNGSVAATARNLKMSRGALQYKIRKYNITLSVSVRDD